MNDFHKKYINKKREVVIENSRDAKTGLLKGVTDNYIHLLIDADDSYKNKLVNVKIKEIFDNERVKGKIIT